MHYIQIDIYMDLKSLLAEIELDVRELKYLANSFETLQNDEELKDLLQRKIQNAQSRLGDMLLQIETIQPVEVENPSITTDAPIKKSVLVLERLEDVSQSAELVEAIEEDASQTGQEEAVVEDVSFLHMEEALPTAIIGEQLRSPGDLRRSISLNDSFRFSRELFDDDNEVMNRVLEQISQMQSYDSAVAFLSAKIKLNEEDETVADLLFLLKKYFN